MYQNQNEILIRFSEIVERVRVKNQENLQRKIPFFPVFLYVDKYGIEIQDCVKKIKREKKNQTRQKSQPINQANKCARMKKGKKRNQQEEKD